MSTQLTATTEGKNDIRSLLKSDNFKQQVALALPQHMTADRFARVALTALGRTPKLMECTRESLLRCLMDCSSLGLEPDGRHAHLIPYKDACTLIIDYKGLIALARRSGAVAVFRAELVKEADEFTWNNGTVTHKVDWRNDRGKTQCVYSYVKFSDGNEDWEVMTLAEVKDIMERSQGYRSAKQYNKSHPWLTDFDEMAKKTAIRRHSKRLTLSPEFADALDKDDDAVEERAVSGRVVPSAEMPRLFGKVEPEPRRSAVSEFWGRADTANIDRKVVWDAIKANDMTDAVWPADLEEDKAEYLLANWDTLTALVAEGGAK